MLKITFDSNVWRPVASPYIFRKNPSIAAFQRLNTAVTQKEILACLAETVFTLEAIPKKDRREFLSYVTSKTRFVEEQDSNESLKVSSYTYLDNSTHPGNKHPLTLHLNDALSLGFKLLHCWRVISVKNPDIDEKWFLLQESPEVLTKSSQFGKCTRAIESMKCGRYHLQQIGNQHAKGGETWQEGLKRVSSSPDSDTAIIEAFAEWADGDSIASHVAYGNDYFCTRDVGKSAGSMSVLSPANRDWLTKTYKVHFISPEELVIVLKGRYNCSV